jgi:predicted regulator of Ras-like GTPase activity (Roadblock/LC7/MglB family)
MMNIDRTRVEKALADFMDSVPELEGVIAFNTNADVISGQMLMEVDQSRLAYDVLNLARSATSISKILGKDKLVELTIKSKEGIILVKGQSGIVICAIAGQDAKRHMGLMLRELAVAIEKATSL